MIPILLAALLVAGAEVVNPPAASAQAALPGDTVPGFLHAQHESVDCTSCHGTDATHGSTYIDDIQDCRSCHHDPPSRVECAACHEAAEIRNRVFSFPRSLDLTVLSAPASRELEFRHQAHEELTCARCHAEGPSLAVPDLDCRSCHVEHHEAEVSCLSCHVDPPGDSHPLEVHLTCAGAACHQDVPVGGSPRERAGCLWCHQDQVDHEPGGECVACHLMPDPEPGLSAGGGE